MDGGPLLARTEEASVHDRKTEADAVKPAVRPLGTRQSTPSPAEHRGRRGHRSAPEEGVGQRLLLTVEEAADCLCVGRTYMFDLIARGVVPSVRIGKLRRIRPEDLERYVSSLR